MKTIIINATAARTSGALTVLKDFMSFLYIEAKIDDYHFHVLTTTHDIFRSGQNITVYELPSQNWYARLLWDHHGLQKWCEKNIGVPDVVVSFQNTCPRLVGAYRSVQLLVYYHQQLPLVKYHWQWRRAEERKLYLYAHFYGYFVNRWNKNARYVVQLFIVKELFCNKFKNISPENVYVIRPNLPKINFDYIPQKNLEKNRKIFLYPATPLRYKNHEVIIQAVKILKERGPEYIKNIQIVFTVSKESFIANRILEMGESSLIFCIGSLSYEELLSYYKHCDALLFPSKIESFGLPLIEAAMFGVPVIVANLPYANEVLADYDNKVFFDPDNPEELADRMELVLTEGLSKGRPMKRENHNTWNDFLEIMDGMLINH